MKAAIFYFLKIFFYMTIGYGGSQLAVYAIFNDSLNIMTPVISGLAFGLSMGVIFTISQVMQVKKLHKGALTPEALSTRQVAQLQTPLTKDQIVARLQQNYPAKDWNLKEEAGLIRLKTTYSWKSFGEKVTIKVNQLQNDFSEVFVESKPRGWITVADYGKNLENITYLRNLLTT